MGNNASSAGYGRQNTVHNGANERRSQQIHPASGIGPTTMATQRGSKSSEDTAINEGVQASAALDLENREGGYEVHGNQQQRRNPHGLPESTSIVDIANRMSSSILFSQNNPSTNNLIVELPTGIATINDVTTTISTIRKLANNHTRKRISVTAGIKITKAGLVQFPPGILGCRELMLLDLSCNLLKHLPIELGSALKQLTRLSLGNNLLEEVPASIGELSELQWLDFTHNCISSLPESVGELKKLKSLGISDCRLSAFPICITRLDKLERVGVFGNLLKSLPKEIGRLKALTKLDLSDNQLSSLPDEICGLEKLTWLNLTRNSLSSLPEKFGNLVNLEELGVSMNRLTSLPRLSMMKRLKVLSAFMNKIERINNDWILGLESLASADLSDNCLAEFPIAFLALPFLSRLFLRANKIAWIEPSLKRSERLILIDVRENQLSCLPWNIRHGIEELRCAVNPFVTSEVFPKNIPLPSLLEICATKIFQCPSLSSAIETCRLTTASKSILSTLATNECQICSRAFVGSICWTICELPSSDCGSVPFLIGACSYECRQAFQVWCMGEMTMEAAATEQEFP